MSDERRSGIASAVADHLLEVGLGDAGLRALAKAAGLSDRMLLYYFKTKDEVLEAALRVVAERMAVLLALVGGEDPERAPPAALLAGLAPMIKAEAVRPYLRLTLQLSAAAASGDGLLRRIGGELVDLFVDWVSARLDVPPSDRRGTALLLLATVDGLALLDSLGRADEGLGALAQATPIERMIP